MFFKSKTYSSPNFNDRVDVDAPSMIILHYTGMKTGKGALEWLCDPDSEVSSHYVIDEKGKKHQLVADDKRAWHAGKSFWNGVTDINSLSIGVEVVNPGHEFGYVPFSDAQIECVIDLCQSLMFKYDIPPSQILGHSDVAISRKVDPGHLFPWDKLAAHEVGLWPVPTEMDYQAAEDMVVNHAAMHELLCAYGYNFEPDFEETLVAYHRHFYPEKFNAWDDNPDEPDVLSCARLLALIRQKHELENAA